MAHIQEFLEGSGFQTFWNLNHSSKKYIWHHHPNLSLSISHTYMLIHSYLSENKFHKTIPSITRWSSTMVKKLCPRFLACYLFEESYPKKRNYSMVTVPSASLDTFPSENENFLCDLMDTAVTKKPCSLETARAPSPRTGSWCSRPVSGLSLWGGRAEFRTLVHHRPPGPL